MKRFIIILLLLTNIYGQHYQVEINNTGEYQLIILEDGITFLDPGDEIGIFDPSGILGNCDPSEGCNNPEYGEVLVGAGIWSGSQLEISAIVSADLSEFGGPILNGAVVGHSVRIKIWKPTEETETMVAANWTFGDGNFGDLFLSISELEPVYATLELGQIDFNENTLEIYVDSNLPIAGFQFNTENILLGGADGGISSENGFNVFTSPNGTVLGISLEGDIIPIGSHLLTILHFISNTSNTICLIDPIISDPYAYSIPVGVGDCISVGCTDPDALNYLPDVEIDDGSCQYPIEIEFGEFQNYYQTFDIMVNAPHNISGFQFVINGIDITNVYGGIAFENGFQIEINEDAGMILGFSLTGNTLPVGENILLSIEYEEISDNIGCITDPIFSDPDGNPYVVDIGSCVPFGCTSIQAINYEENAIADDGSCVFDIPESFLYNISVLQSFYFIENATLDGIELSNEDWIGLFKNDLCVGAREWNGSFTDVPGMGDDGEDYTDGYLVSGDLPEFYIFDASENEIHPAQANSIILSDDTEYNGWNNLLFINVDSLIAISPDCSGTYNGTAFLDDCNVCSGGNTSHIPNSDIDCQGNCFGEAEIDYCGICSGGTTGHIANSDDLGCGCFDPAPEIYYIDVDGDGLGAGDGLEFCLDNIPENWVENQLDVDPYCYTNDTDDCGICGGGNESLDCFGICSGGAILDECGVCDGDSSSCNAPVVIDQDISILEDELLNITLNAIDPNDDILSFTILLFPIHGNLNIENIPDLTYLPHPDYTGDDLIIYTVSDGEWIVEGQVNITINEYNDPPSAESFTINLLEDQSTDVILVGNDLDDDELSFEIFSGPNHGILSNNRSLEFYVYIPDENYFGNDSFTYSVSDGNSTTYAEIFFIINPINDSPIISNQDFIIDQNTNLEIFIECIDPDQDETEIELISGPFHGSLIGDLQSGSVIYEPNPDFQGTDQILLQGYEINTPESLYSDQALIQINITDINDPPIAYDLTYNLMEEDTVNFVLLGSDIDSDELVYNIIEYPQYGIIEGSPPDLTYHGELNFYGIDELIYSVNDGELSSIPATITFSIINKNDFPISEDFTFEVNDPMNYQFNVESLISDVDLDELYVNFLPENNNGVGQTIFGGSVTNLNDYNYEYSNPMGMNIDYIFYKANDIISESNVSVLTFNIPNGRQTPDTNIPIALSQTINIPQDTPFTIPYIGFDINFTFPIDGTSEFNIVQQPVNGTLSDDFVLESLFSSNFIEWGSLYTPALGFTGLDSIIYVVSNPQNTNGEISENGVLILNINETNQPPEIENISSQTTLEDFPLVIPFTFNDDNSNLELSYSISNNQNFSASIENINTNSAEFIIQPDLNYVGSVVITISATEIDNESLVGSTTFTLSVIPVNDPPMMLPIQNKTTYENTSISIILNAMDIDNDSDIYFLSNLDDNTNLDSFTLIENNLTIIPAIGFTGNIDVSVSANDGMDESEPVSFVLQVIDINNIPFISEIIDPIVCNEDEENIMFTIFPQDLDTDDILTVSSIYNTSFFENIIIDPASSQSNVERNITFTPINNKFGNSIIILNINDGQASNYFQVPINVSSVNDPPVILNSEDKIINEDQSITFDIQASDIEGDPLVFSSSDAIHFNISINENNFTISPQENFVGSEIITAYVSDNLDLDSSNFMVTVLPVNDAPLIISTPPDFVYENQNYIYQIDVEDVDNSEFFYQLLEYPEGMTISNTGLIEWTPDNIYSSGLVRIIVLDGNEDNPLSASQEFIIAVLPVNDPPYIVSDPNAIASPNSIYNYQVIVMDEDDEYFTFDLLEKPLGMTISSTGLISWLPNVSDTIIGPVIVQATDGGENDVVPALQEYYINVLSSSVITMEYVLNEGSNLIGFTGLPAYQTIPEIFSPIENSINSIIGEGVATTHIGDGVWIGNLENFVPTGGYWVIMENQSILSLEINPYNHLLQYDLHYGNNLISYPYSGSINISDGIPDDVESYFTGVIGEGIAATQISPGNWVGSLTHWEGTKGYWVKLNTDVEFNFIEPTNFIRNNTISNSDLDNPFFEYEQSINQAFYFIEKISLSNTSLDIGDWIIAYNGNEIVGSRKWIGEYTDIPVMGSYNSATLNYCNNGDKPTFKIFKENSGNLINLDGEIPEWENNGIFLISLYNNEINIPEDFMIKSIYPNPFNPVATIEYSIPVDEMIRVSIFDLQGRLMTQLVDEIQSAGYHSITWNASDMPSGLYFVTLMAGEYKLTKKLMLIK